jgi:hypothetical protein
VKKRLYLNLSLLAVLLASCAPAAATAESPPQPIAPPVVVEPSATPVADSPAVEAAPTEALAPTPLPVATSRGPDLEATDPSTVSLASGELQFVEFFRFT